MRCLALKALYALTCSIAICQSFVLSEDALVTGATQGLLLIFESKGCKGFFFSAGATVEPFAGLVSGVDINL